MTQTGDLPMAPDGCTLDDSDLGEQLDRYRRLGATAVAVQDSDMGLVITLGVGVDSDLVRETVAVELGCCRFFTLDYDAPGRRLSIGIEDPAHADALGFRPRATSLPCHHRSCRRPCVVNKIGITATRRR
jgi:hypothetical protein